MKRFFDTLLASSLHGAVLCSLTLYLIATGGMGNNPVYTKSPLGFAVMQIALGYFIADFLVCMCDSHLRRDIGSLVHHLASIIGISLALYYQGRFMFFIVFRFTSEFSTPFVNLFWSLRLLNQKDTKLFYFASVSLLVSFFVCRILPILWIWMLFVRTVLHPASRIVPSLVLVWTVFNYGMFDVLNVFWFKKMVKGAIKLVTVTLRKKS